MAHWAELDDNNVVLRVLVGSNDDPDEGYSWLVENLGGRWLKTSYNTYAGQHLLGGTPFRGNYAGIGYKYHEDLDAFIPPQPFPSWVVDVVTFNWIPPIPRPDDDNFHVWDEEAGHWVIYEDGL